MNIPSAFREVWIYDFEFVAPTGRRPDPVCLAAVELRSGRTFRAWRDELRSRRDAPFPTGPDSLHVCYFASAEMGCFLSLGWPSPCRIADLYAEHRRATNLALDKGRRKAALGGMGDGLIAAATMRGIDAMALAAKDANRELIMRGGPWSGEERERILEYCAYDAETTRRLLAAMVERGEIDWPRALLRGRCAAATARMEATGVPVDAELLARLRVRWPELKARVAEGEATAGVFDGASFREDRFVRFLADRGIRWPRHESGRPVLDDDTFAEMADATPEVPEIRTIRKVRRMLAQTRLFADLAVGPDGRNRVLLSPFATATGRNAPSNSRFVFGPSAWVRGLIRPEPGRALAYVDYTAQEFGIGARLSGDRAMNEAYDSGHDVYLAFGVAAGVVPPDALAMDPAEAKTKYKAERKRLKAAVLGNQYGLGAEGLANRIGVSRREAAGLRDRIRRASPEYERWIQAAVARAMATNELGTCFGWRTVVHADTKPTTLLNWPLQAHGAEMLRLACCMLTEAGVRVCAPVHDAVLIEAPADAIESEARRTMGMMAEASRIVLGGSPLRCDAEIVRHPDRLLDDDSRPFWDRLMGHLRDLEASG